MRDPALIKRVAIILRLCLDRRSLAKVLILFKALARSLARVAVQVRDYDARRHSLSVARSLILPNGSASRLHSN